MSELRMTYGADERRTTPGGRRLEDDGTGLVDTVLFARIALEHRAAEEAYFRALERGDHGALVAGLNGKAEGLAFAVSLLAGLDVVDVRARASADSKARQRAGLDGVALARRSLEASRLR